VGEHLADEGFLGAAGESKISKYDFLVAAMNRVGLAGSSRPAPSPVTPPVRGHEGVPARSAMSCAGDRTIDGTAGRLSRPEPKLTAGTFHLMAALWVAGRDDRCTGALPVNGLFVWIFSAAATTSRNKQFKLISNPDICQGPQHQHTLQRSSWQTES
jgi:hypothetical protein